MAHGSVPTVDIGREVEEEAGVLRRLEVSGAEDFGFP